MGLLENNLSLRTTPVWLWQLFLTAPCILLDNLSFQVITLVLDNLGGKTPEGFDAGLKGLVLVANLDFLVPGCPPGAL